MRWAEFKDILKRGVGRGTCPHQLAFLLESGLRRFILSPERLADRLGLHEAGRVIELGPGPGYFSRAVASRIPRGYLLLVDLQSEMLQQARGKLARSGLGNAGFVQADATALPVPSGVWDCVFLVAVLGEVSDSGSCLREIYRALRPGGLLSVTEQPGDPDFVALRDARELAEGVGFRLDNVHGGGKNYTASFRKWRVAGWSIVMTLRSRLILRFSLGLLITAAILFVPSGSWRYWQAWIFLAVVFAYLLYAFLNLYKHDRKLLERRLRSKEKISEQRRLVGLLRPAFFLVCLLPGFDYRLGWSRRLLGGVPVWLSLVSHGLVLCGLLTVSWVLRVNSFASRTIEVEAGQTVISTGPYALVRHPMYSGSILIWLFMPLALGSYVAWPAFVLLIPFYVYRLLNEEKFLCRELPGYSEYCLRTRFRLIPFVW